MVMRQVVFSVVGLLAFSGCGPHIYDIVVTAEPSGASISIDGDTVGVAPVSTALTFGTSKTVYVVGARETGYFDLERIIYRDSVEVRNGVIHMALEQNPAWVETTTNEATNKWLSIQIADHITKEQMWHRLVSSVTNYYDILERLEPHSGYLRSTVIAKEFFHPRDGAFQLRTQFLGTIESENPLIYKIKIIAQQCKASDHCRDNSRIFHSDAQLVEELVSILGIVEGKEG